MGISHVVVNNELIFTLNDFLLCLESARLMGKRLPQNRTPLPPPFPQTACNIIYTLRTKNFQTQRCHQTVHLSKQKADRQTNKQKPSFIIYVISEYPLLFNTFA